MIAAATTVTNVNAEFWKRVEDVFEQALEIPERERAPFLDRACTGNEELRREVASLLDSHARAGSFIDKRSLFFATESVNHTTDAIRSGQFIGAYRVVRELGRGGMGAVYLAERADDQFEQRVAIKLIKRGMDSDSMLRQFRNERQILASFDHPNIARLFDGGTTADGVPYFVMEYVEGVPLDEFRDQQSLSIENRLRLFLQVCGAVSYAHRRTVIHRDIKPSNILVTGDGTPKLLDFGIAKMLQSDIGGEAAMTFTGARAMTPEYASPEQVRGEPVTTVSDVYSLGVVLYELVTGGSPYRLTTRSPNEIERAVNEQEPAKPSTTHRTRLQRVWSRGAGNSATLLRGDLDNVLLMALRKEPGRRYQSVEQFADDIRRCLESRPVLARPATISYRATKFVERNRIATAAGVLLFFSLVAGLGATSWQAHRAEVERARAERRFNDVRQLAHSVLFDYHDAIKNLPGATAVRERLVKDALVYLDSLAGETSGDPALQREVAAAYERVGDVRGEMYGASLGDTAGALDSYRKSLGIREALAAANPADVTNQRDLAYGYMKIGSQLQDTGDAGRGLEYLRKACALYRRLADQHPDDPETRDYLSRAHNELGIALQQWGDAAGALENHQEALRLRQDLLAAQPDNALHRRHLAITYWDLGQALALRGDLSGALQANHKAMESSAKLLAENPTNVKDRRRLAISYQMDGEYRAQNGDIAGALDSITKKLWLDEQSLADDGVNAQARGDVAYSYAKIGELLAAKRDYSEALADERKALRLYETLATDSPQDLTTRHQTGVVASMVAELLARIGSSAEALDSCAKALALVNTLPTGQMSSIYGDLRGQAYLHLGAAHAQLGRSSQLPAGKQTEQWRTAHDLFQRSLDVWQEMQKRGTLSAGNAKRPEQVAAEIAKCDLALAGKP